MKNAIYSYSELAGYYKGFVYAYPLPQVEGKPYFFYGTCFIAL